jgi:hypothetical protein
MSGLRTSAEVAADLHVTPRRVRELARLHAVPVLVPGRDFLFDETAYRLLCEAIKKCTSASPDVPAPRSGGSRGRSMDSEYERALALGTKGLPTSALPKSGARPAKLPSTGKQSTAPRHRGAALQP